MDSWYFIVPCLMVAIGAIGLGGYAIGLRATAATATLRSSVEPAVSADQPQYLKDVSFAYDSQLPLGLSAALNITTDRLRIYVDAAPLGPSSTLGTGPNFRAPIEELHDVVKGQRINVQLVSRSSSEPNKAFWGASSNNHYLDGINAARLVVIGPDGREQHFYFLLIKGLQNQPFYPLLTSKLDWAQKWEASEK